MKLFSFFKKEIVEEKPARPALTKGQDIARKYAMQSHKTRVGNLKEEFEQLSLDLKHIESDFDSTKQKREKSSDTIIRRLSIIEYEIEIREGLIEWLS